MIKELFLILIVIIATMPIWLIGYTFKDIFGKEREGQ